MIQDTYNVYRKLVVFLALELWFMPLNANDFRDLPVLSSANQQLEVSMKAMTTDVRIGNYQVKENNSLQVCDRLGTHCAMPYEGVVLKLNPKDTLKINLQNSLVSNGKPTPPFCMSQVNSNAFDNSLLNLHTHGVLVSPYAKDNGKDKLFGDNIFSCTSSSSANGSVLGATMRYNMTLNDIAPGKPHPLGIDWIHPHIHGLAKAQVSSGMSSMIIVGDINKQFCVKALNNKEKSSSHCLPIQPSNVKHLLLKDAQLYKKAGQADNSQEFFNFADQNPDFCGVNKLDSSNFGECAVDLSALDDPSVKSGKWVFTINGVQTPHWNIAANRYEIWRIQNASANVTYHLSLQPLAFGGKPPQKAAFHILDIDGAGLASPNNGSVTMPTTTDLLLMPSSRADLLVQLPPEQTKDTTYALVNDNFQTGYQIGDADVWPHITLATVTFKASHNPVTVEREMRAPQFLTAIPTVQPPIKGELANKVDNNCIGLDDPSLTAEKRQFYYDHLHVAPPWKRRIYFGVSPDDVFALGQTLINPSGKEIDNFGDAIDASKNPVKLWPFDMTTDKTRLCVSRHPEDEIWELVNVSSEVHNFHIHQIKFAVVRESTGSNKGKPVMRAPSSIDQADIPNKLLFRNGVTELLHDVIIVPRGKSVTPDGLNSCSDSLMQDPNNPYLVLKPSPNLCDGSGSPTDLSGMIEIKLNFGGNQLAAFKTGTGKKSFAKFVYHCHILEHEDKGMMAGITVIDPLIDN